MSAATQSVTGAAEGGVERDGKHGAKESIFKDDPRCAVEEIQ